MSNSSSWHVVGSFGNPNNVLTSKSPNSSINIWRWWKKLIFPEELFLPQVVPADPLNALVPNRPTNFQKTDWKCYSQYPLLRRKFIPKTWFSSCISSDNLDCKFHNPAKKIPTKAEMCQLFLWRYKKFKEEMFSPILWSSGHVDCTFRTLLRKFHQQAKIS